MSKRNKVSYIKPADPKFLRQIKEQIGYREGPTVEAKRQKLESGDLSSGSDSEEESPQVVVLKKGDLTAEEAESEKKRIEKEEDEKPADLSQKIVFKSNRSQKTESEQTVSDPIEKIVKKKRPEPIKNKLSFQDEIEENSDDY